MKTKTTKTILLALLISFGLNTNAQVAINDDGSAPDSSAMLDIKSTNKGLLLPRMNTVQISGISNPAAGLIVFNIDSSDFYGYNGSKWISIWNPGDTLADWYCGNVLVDSRDGKSYTTVQIGTQCWMEENLNYETANSWAFNNDPANGDIYGRLYTWDAAITACPTGWHLPSDEEWKTLEMHLGMSISEADTVGWRGTHNEGGQLKETETTHWNSPNSGATNASGFNALPGGYRHYNGSFYDLGYFGGWWSSTEDSGTNAWGRGLGYNNDQVNRNNYNKASGVSVRCLKD